MRPWRYERDPDNTGFVPHARVWGPSVTVQTSGNLDQTEPDMLLIAAAPELAKALTLMVEELEAYQCGKATAKGWKTAHRKSRKVLESLKP